jgi:hypothetical protein
VEQLAALLTAGTLLLVAWLKGHRAYAIAGLFIPFLLIVAACCLAKPDSWWATTKYDRKKTRASRASVRQQQGSELPAEHLSAIDRKQGRSCAERLLRAVGRSPASCSGSSALSLLYMLGETT